MPQHTRESDAPSLRVRFAADTASVPGVRRFVTDGLNAWGRAGLVEDAALCVTEMAANAALHSGSNFMNVSVRELSRSVRLAVEDDGVMIPVEAFVPRAGISPDEPDRDALPLEDQPTTGRGLAIVSVLAKSWGVDEIAQGRRIWADLTEDDEEYPVRPPEVTRQNEALSFTEGSLPDGWTIMRMLRCPVDVAMRLDEHLDALVRELQLIDTHDQNSPPQRISRLIHELVTKPAYARHAGRRIGEEGRAKGLEFVDVAMPAPRELAPNIRRLHDVLEQADELCAEQQLLTLTSTPEMRLLRDWFTESMLGQLEHDAEPVPYADWLASRTSDRQPPRVLPL